MKVLVIGSGGREHSIAWRLRQDSTSVVVFTAPGNPGCARVSRCIQPSASTPEAYLDIARQVGADLTVVGPEAPLVDGVVDLFEAKGLPIVGPTKAAARLEGSKIFSKHFLERAGIPTARFVSTDDLAQARHDLGQFSYPVVIKG